jgi:cytoskeletal protein RodZ
MHELERRALDDPFLREALEGFEQTSGNQEANLGDLNARLHQRTLKKERRIIPWIPLSAAASILIVLGAGIWFFASRQDSEKTKLVARDVTPENKKESAAAPSAVAIDTQKQEKSANITQTDNPKLIADNSYKKTDTAKSHLKEVSLAKAKVNPPASADISVAQENKSPVLAEPSAAYDKSTGYYSPKKDSVAANEMLVSDIAKKKKANTTTVKYKSAAPPQTIVQSKVDGVSVTPDESRTVTGTVMGSDGTPITGATVKVAGRGFGAVTDVNGKFVLPDVTKGQTLSVNYIGYSAKKVKADKDSMSISLNPTTSSLGEVVVTRESTKNEDAHPRDGWNSFEDYLKKDAQSPDGKTGKVKVSFIVAADGSLSQFKVVKSLSDDADKKAISMISGGPAWAGGTDGKPKEITVSVKFH